jgi:hypothetical protein
MSRLDFSPELGRRWHGREGCGRRVLLEPDLWVQGWDTQPGFPAGFVGGACSRNSGVRFHGTPGKAGSAVHSTSSRFEWKHGSPLCHPDRTRICYHAAPKMTSCAAFIKESRLNIWNPSRSTGNPGKWRDLQFTQPAADSNRSVRHRDSWLPTLARKAPSRMGHPWI